MDNFTLKIIQHNGEAMVPYLMKQPTANVAGLMPPDKARILLAKGIPHKGREDYPITSDDVYFFAGCISDEETAEPTKPSRKTRRRKE